MTKEKTLNRPLLSLQIGDLAVVTGINANPKTKRRFFDLGIVCGTTIQALYKSPFGDPIAYLIRGSIIALRSEDCLNIFIR